MLVAERQSDDWVREQVAQLPRLERQELAEGPLEGPAWCRVCTALRWLEGTGPPFKRKLLACDPVTNLLDYHAVDEADGRVSHADADEMMSRCLQIYRAAGWAG